MIVNLESHPAVYEAIVTIPGDETVGLYPTDMRIVFDDGYLLEGKEDYSYLVKEIKNLVENLYGERPWIYLYDDNGNEIAP